MSKAAQSVFFPLALALPLIAHAEHTYPAVPSDYHVIPGTIFQVDHMPPIKDQDGLGICYGAAPTAVLEQFRCAQLGKCTTPESDERLSMLDVASYDSDPVRKINSRGSVDTVLTNISAQANPRIARESCASIAALAGEQENDRDSLQIQKKETSGYAKLRDIYDRGHAQRDPGVCIQDLQSVVESSFQSNLSDLEKVFRSDSFEEFSYKVLVPQKCRSDAAEIPPYVTGRYPDTSTGKKTVEKATPEGLRDLLVQNIQSQIPTVVSICSERDAINTCSDGHSLVVKGVRQLCSSTGCKLSFQLQNSYGLTWQQEHGDGWVDGDWLLREIIEASVASDGSSVAAVYWITSPGQVIASPYMPIYTQDPNSHSVLGPDEARVILRPEVAPEVVPVPKPSPELRVKPRPVPVPPPPKQRPQVDPRKSGGCPDPVVLRENLFKCIDSDGSVTFTDDPKNCQCTGRF